MKNQRILSGQVKSGTREIFQKKMQVSRFYRFDEKRIEYVHCAMRLTSVAPTYKNVPAVIATIIPSINGVAIFDINTPAVTPRGPDSKNSFIEVTNIFMMYE